MNSNIKNSNTKKISTRQLCFLLAFFLPVNKLIILPSALSGTATNDLLLSALLTFLLQGLSIFVVLWFMKKNQAPVSELIAQRFGQVGKGVYLTLLGGFFLLSAFYLVLEQWSYVVNTMYDTRPSFLVFAPFFLFSCYASAKGLQCIGRSADISLFLFPVSIVILFFMAIGSADFTSLLPVGGAGMASVAKGVLLMVVYCAEAAYLLGFSGEVEIEKHFLKKTMIAYGVGSLVVLVFLAIFYGIFSTIAVREVYAISKIARYYNALKTIGRVDFIFIYAVALVQLFALVVPISLAVHCFCNLFQTQKHGLVSLIVNALLGLTTFFSVDYFLSVHQWITQNLWAVFVAFGFVLPCLCFLIKQKRSTHVRDE